MRKFSARWWITDPHERYMREIQQCESRGHYGVSVRYSPGNPPPGVSYERHMFISLGDVFAVRFA